jgi:hypothetical protein
VTGKAGTSALAHLILRFSSKPNTHGELNCLPTPFRLLEFISHLGMSCDHIEMPRRAELGFHLRRKETY